MNERLKQFLNAENISQSQFADTLGVAKASVSHILAGRNKPGFDFIESMARHYPSLNLEWLITGKGRMYSGMAVNTSNSENSSIFSSSSLFPSEEDAVEPPRESNIPRSSPQPSRILNSQPDKIESKLNSIQTSKRSISRLIVFYDDGTYSELS